MKTLPLTVLFFEGPMARSYLARLRQANFRVQQIIRITPRARSLGKFLPSGLRADGAARKQHKAAHYWPAQLCKSFPGLYNDMIEKIGGAFGVDGRFFEEVRRYEPLDRYSDTVINAEVDGIKDPELLKMLTAHESKDVLFTGGGILPKGIFNIDGLRLFHVHPGYLPDVRGADGMLWSVLTRGMPGASCFLMAPGLDEGDLIEARDYGTLTFTIPDNEKPDAKSLYRMLFSFYDPIIRADLLADIFNKMGDPAGINGTPQDLKAGLTYHFMEGRLQKLALAELFSTATSRP